MDPKTYKFTIDAYSPSTIPMARLAEYMDALAKLMGNKNEIHFAELQEGSCSLLVNAEPEAQPKVCERLREAGSSAPDKELREAYGRLDGLLREDNATGQLSEGDAKVIKFPGAKRKLPHAVGPFKQDFTVEGQLARVGGTDKTAHALIVDSEGKVWSCELTRDTAKTLGSRLYELIRITGESRWLREEDGTWSIKGFRLHTYEFLEESDLMTAVTKLRGVNGQLLPDAEDKVEFLRELRGE